MPDLSKSDDISPRQQRIAELARQMPSAALGCLSRHIDLDLLREAFRRTRRSGAPGIDQQTAQEYAVSLDSNLTSLLNRFKSGLYRAPPVRRVHIPKGNGKTRPIGIPTIEDKILQRAVLMVLEPLYEQDFKDFSWGFRPGRRIHDGLGLLRERLMAFGGGWVLEVDIKSFFDDIDHKHLRSFLGQRVRDGVILRTIGKWLKAGVLEDGVVHRPGSGSPQGGVISPLLANVYLHYVFDSWFTAEVAPRMRGGTHVMRFADDIVIAFSQESDARRVLDILPKRFGRFGLTLHPDKTRLVRFERPTPTSGGGGFTAPETFDFLGLTHYWGRSRRGWWVIKQRTAKSRFQRGCSAIKAWCQRYRHLPVEIQAKQLGRKLLGHYNYYGVPGNYSALSRYHSVVVRIWFKWLNRRSQIPHMNWGRFAALLERYPLPSPRLRRLNSGAANP